jgi:hypothetical protein
MCAGLNKQKKIAKTFQRKLLNAFFPVLYEFVKFAAVQYSRLAINVFSRTKSCPVAFFYK